MPGRHRLAVCRLRCGRERCGRGDLADPGEQQRTAIGNAEALVISATGARPDGEAVALTQPRIVELLLVTATPAMLVAQRGLPPIRVVRVSANTVNCYTGRPRRRGRLRLRLSDSPGGAS
jgi:hypothetical protein